MPGVNPDRCDNLPPRPDQRASAAASARPMSFCRHPKTANAAARTVRLEHTSRQLARSRCASRSHFLFARALPWGRRALAFSPQSQAEPYYDLGVPDSDEEQEPVPSDASGMTDVRDAASSESDDTQASPETIDDASSALPSALPEAPTTNASTKRRRTRSMAGSPSVAA